MKGKPFFSVIVPAYNSEEFIRKGLDSIKAQSFTDYELIIVCDQCRDNTAEVAREYTDRVFEIDHSTDGPGVNVGLDEARGEWVLFMDDDDWFMHEYVFETLAEMIREYGKQYEIDIVAFSFIWRHVGYTRNTPQHVYPATWNKCWRREFIGDERFPEWEHSNDYGFAMKMHPKARFAYWDMPLYYYNFMRPGCVSEQIRDGKMDNSRLPEEIRSVAEGYEKALKSGGFKR